MSQDERSGPWSAGWSVGRRLAACGFALSVLLAACTSTASPSASPSASSSPTPAASVTIAPSPTPSPTPSVSPTIGACASTHLAARVTPVQVGSAAFVGWQGAAGSRIADVEMTNTGSACTLSDLSRPQLIDGTGAVLIDGAAPGASALLTVGPGTVLKTVVTVANYCGPAPAAPVTVAFVLNGGTDRVVAAPVSATDTSGVPPCNGPAGSPGTIEMHPWAP